MRTNLLTETLEILSENDKSSSDVLWVGATKTGYFSWQAYETLANQNYYSGHGGQEICSDLMVVGKDWWLERHEYDGAEWWEFKTTPKRPDAVISPSTLIADISWSSLADIVSKSSDAP